jgi:hypothetical protein
LVQCLSLKINDCRHLIEEFGDEAVRRDNICKTQCSFALNSRGNAGRHPDNLLITLDTSETLQAAGTFTHRPNNQNPRNSERDPSGKHRHPPHPPITGNGLRFNGGFHGAHRTNSPPRRPGFTPAPPLPPRAPLRPTSKIPIPNGFENNPTTPSKGSAPGRNEPVGINENSGLGTGPPNMPNNAPPSVQTQPGQPAIGPNLRPPTRRPSRTFGFFHSLPNLDEIFGL